MLDLSVVIVNYNTLHFLRRCLRSLECQVDVRPQIVVVDNASRDNSLEMMRNEFPDIDLIANEKNMGFARANNQALKSCKSEYVYFLNPDTEVRQGALRAMVQFMDLRPKVGLAGTRMINHDGSPQPSVEFRYPGQKYAKQELAGLDKGIAWILGASMIARSRLIDGLNGFDERFFLYGEEQDLCLRARRVGWTIGFISEAVVVHWGGQSEEQDRPLEVWKKKFQAELVFYKKHYTPRTIRAIKRANRVQALWRIATLKLLIPFSRNRQNELNKLAKYRLALKTFRARV